MLLFLFFAFFYAIDFGYFLGYHNFSLLASPLFPDSPCFHAILYVFSKSSAGTIPKYDGKEPRLLFLSALFCRDSAKICLSANCKVAIIKLRMTPRPFAGDENRKDLST